MAIVSMVDQESLHQHHDHDNSSQSQIDVCPKPVEQELEMNNRNAMHGMGNNTNNSMHSEPEIIAHPVKGKQYSWDQSTQGWILGAFFYTYILIQMPAGIIAEKFGGRWVILVCIFGSATISLITPLITDFPVGVLIAARLILGCCQAGCFPSCFGILVSWMPLKERSSAFSLLNTGAKVGACLPYFFSGVLIASYGWPALFYVPGVVTTIVLIIFFIMVRSKPEDHPFISEKELMHIQSETQAESSKAEKPQIPWLRIITNKSVLAVAFFQFACFWILTIFFSFIPKYLNEVLHVPVGKNGIFNGFVYLISLISLLTTGFLSEIVIQKGILSRTNTRKAFSLITGTATAVCFFFIPACGCNQTSLMILVLVGSVLSGFSSGSDTPLASEMSKNFPSALFALLNMTATSTGFIAPAFCGAVLQSLSHDPWLAWKIIFFVSAAINIFANILYCIFVSAERQPFDFIGGEEPVVKYEVGNSTAITNPDNNNGNDANKGEEVQIQTPNPEHSVNIDTD
jgi:sugar phosphate permease